MPYRTRIFFSAVATMVTLGFGGPAVADDFDTCAKESGDVALDACSRAIASGRYKGHDLARLYVNRGAEYEGKGEYDRAIVDYTTAIRFNPEFALAFRNRGDAYRKKGEYDRAIADYTEAIRLNPEYDVAFNNRGYAYDDNGEYDRAIADYSEAIRLDPKYAVAFNNRGVAYENKGEYDRAIADYTEALRLDPKYLRAFRNRGDAYRANSEYDRAIADYTEAIRIDPKYEQAYFNRGIANLYAGSLPNALADLNQASELDPKDRYTALWLDIVNKRSNLPSRLPQAVSHFDMTAWPAPVIRLFLGQLTPDAVLVAADDPDAKKKMRQVCEANFYSGELALQQNAKSEAARLFRLAAQDCPKTAVTFTERIAANAELKALGAGR